MQATNVTYVVNVLHSNKVIVQIDTNAVLVYLRQWARKSEVVEKSGKQMKITKNVPVTKKLTLEEVIKNLRMSSKFSKLISTI